jgi:SanA protein
MSLQRADRPRPLRRLLWRGLLALGALGLLGLLLVVFLNGWMVRAANGQIYSRAADVPATPVALVLGAGPGSLYFDYRLDAAAALYKAGKVRHLLVSGDGASLDPLGSETALMWEGLRRRGIPAAAITRDDAGLRTLDSMARAKIIFRLKSVVIVSQEFHLPRALYLARAWGLDAVGYAADDPGGDFYDSSFREWLARVKAVADVEILGTPPKKLGPPTPIVLDVPGLKAAANF